MKAYDKHQGKEGFIKFLGTAGARFVMIKQLRFSAGIWLSYKGTNIIVDPGPGALLRSHKSRPKLDPEKLDGIIVTHKHLDHSNDLNVMIEAMTGGGFKKRGTVLIPSDSLNTGESIVLPYLKEAVADLSELKQGKYKIGEVEIDVPVRNIHPVETYGIKFLLDTQIVSLVSDTRFFPELAGAYKGSTVLILNVVFYQGKPGYDHLCLEEALDLVKAVKPEKAVFTHFGMSMLRQGLAGIEKEVRDKLDCDVKFAYDGFRLELPVENDRSLTVPHGR